MRRECRGETSDRGHRRLRSEIAIGDEVGDESGDVDTPMWVVQRSRWCYRANGKSLIYRRYKPLGVDTYMYVCCADEARQALDCLLM